MRRTPRKRPNDVDAQSRLATVTQETIAAQVGGISARRLIATKQRETDAVTQHGAIFVDFIRNSPLKGIALDLTRDRTMPRKGSL